MSNEAVGVANPMESARQLLITHDSSLITASRSFVRNQGAMVGLALVGLCVVLALVGPLLTPYHPLDQYLSEAFKSPSLAHPLGTDELGRDTLTRLLYGSRITLLITLGA